MNIYTPAAIGLLILSSCTSTDLNSVSSELEEKSKVLYANDVGDIPRDSKIDKDDFILCDSTQTMQGRSRLRYPGGVKALEDLCLSTFKYTPEFKSYTGYITIRFMINCQNQTGRFRAHSLDLDFSPKNCPSMLKDELISISKNLIGWEKSSREKPTAEYSKYINFKINHGRIEHVLM